MKNQAALPEWGAPSGKICRDCVEKENAELWKNNEKLFQKGRRVEIEHYQPIVKDLQKEKIMEKEVCKCEYPNSDYIYHGKSFLGDAKTAYCHCKRCQLPVFSPENKRENIMESIHLANKYEAEPKEYFKIVKNLLKSKYGNRGFSIIDVGCAIGEFLYYLRNNLLVTRSLGTDISEKMINRAKRNVGGEFIVDSILKPTFFGKFDVCSCLGILFGQFDEVEVPLQYLLGLSDTVIIFDIFNDELVDMRMRYRVQEEWLPGFNINSTRTVENLIKKIGDFNIKWIDLKMPFPIPKGSSPMRTWTIRTENNPHQIVVGTGQMLFYKVLVIEKRQ